MQSAQSLWEFIGILIITIYKRMYENKQKKFLKIHFFFLKSRNKKELTLCLC